MVIKKVTTAPAMMGIFDDVDAGGTEDGEGDEEPVFPFDGPEVVLVPAMRDDMVFIPVTLDDTVPVLVGGMVLTPVDRVALLIVIPRRQLSRAIAWHEGLTYLLSWPWRSPN